MWCPRIRIALAAYLIGAICISAPASAQPLRITFLSVGQGDATLIESPTGKRVLIDGGPPEGTQALITGVGGRGKTPLDLVLLTHRHVDHLGGLARLIELIGTRTFLDAPFPHPTPAYRALLGVLEARHIPVREALRGRRVELGGEVVLELLGPPDPPLSGTRSDVNSNSVVARLDYRHASVLFAADAEAPTERWLLQNGAHLRARVLKVAHHGSRYSSTAAFLRAVHPEAAVISVGAVNDYHHPSLETIARLQRLGAEVYRTDRDGDVSLTSDGERLSFVTARPHAEEK